MCIKRLFLLVFCVFGGLVNPLHGQSTCDSPYILDGFPGDDGVDIIKFGPVVFLARDHTSGVSIYDVSVDQQPVQIGNITLPSECLAIELQWPVLYAATKNDGLYLFDVTNPVNAIQVSHFDRGGRFSDMVMQWPYVYIADVVLGLQIVDVSSSIAPSLVYESDLNGDFPSQLAVQGSLLAVGTTSRLVMPVDVSNPAKPEIGGSIPIDERVSSLAIHAELQQVFVGMEASIGSTVASKIDRIDVSDQFNPSRINEIVTYDTSTDILVQSDRLIVVSKSGGLLFFDLVSDLEAIIESKWSFPYDSNAVYIENGRAYIAHSTWRFSIIETDSLQTPLPLGFIDYSNEIRSLAIENEMLYSGNRQDGLVIVDITDPSAPVVQGEIEGVIDTNERIIVKDQIVYFSNHIGINGVMKIVDASNPEQPELLSEIQFESTIYDFDLHDSLLYVANGFFNPPQIFDVSNPANPVEVEFLSGIGNAAGISINGDIAYIATYSDFLYRFDISDPSAIVALGSQEINYTSRHVYAGDQFAVIGLDVYSVLDDGSISFLTQLPHPQGELRDLLVIGNRVYTASRGQGVYIFELSDPAEPVRLAQYIPELNNSVYDIAVVGDTLYLPRQNQGVQLLDLSGMCSTDCHADLNGDDIVDFFDASIFIQAYINNEPIADFNSDQIYNFFDVSAFLQAFAQGCP